MHIPRLLQQNRRREADENVDFILATFSFTLDVSSPLSTDWSPPSERFLFDEARAVHWAFLAGPLAGAGTLVGTPTFGRRVVLTLVRTPDPVIADGPGGIAPDFKSTAAAETPNECIELGQTFLFSGTYHYRHAMTVPEPPFRGSCVELALLPVVDPWGACAEEEEDGWPASIGIPPDE